MYVLYETVLGVKALKWDFQLCNFSSTIHFSATNAKMHYSKKWREHSIITWYDTKSFKPQHISLSFHLKQCCKWVFLQSSSSRTAKWPPAELLVHVSHQTVRNKLHEGPMCFSAEPGTVQLKYIRLRSAILEELDCLCNLNRLEVRSSC